MLEDFLLVLCRSIIDGIRMWKEGKENKNRGGEVQMVSSLTRTDTMVVHYYNFRVPNVHTFHLDTHYSQR